MVGGGPMIGLELIMLRSGPMRGLEKNAPDGAHRHTDTKSSRHGNSMTESAPVAVGLIQ